MKTRGPLSACCARLTAVDCSEIGGRGHICQGIELAALIVAVQAARGGRGIMGEGVAGGVARAKSQAGGSRVARDRVGSAGANLAWVGVRRRVDMPGGKH